MKCLESDYTTEFLFVSNKCFLLDSQKKKKKKMSKIFVKKSFVILISGYNSVSQPRNYLTQISYLENYIYC